MEKSFSLKLFIAVSILEISKLSCFEPVLKESLFSPNASGLAVNPFTAPPTTKEFDESGLKSIVLNSNLLKKESVLTLDNEFLLAVNVTSNFNNPSVTKSKSTKPIEAFTPATYCKLLFVQSAGLETVPIATAVSDT